MAITLNGTTGITNDGGYTGDGVSFADTTPSNTLVTTTGGNVGVGTSSPSTKLTIASSSYQDHLLIDRTGIGSMQLTATNPRGLAITDGTNSFLQIVQSNGNLQFNSGYGSVATAYGCRAWVNFNGSGTVAIRASGNVSSITDNGTGNFTVNFSTALTDANYSVAGMAGDTGGVGNRGLVALYRGVAAPSTSSFTIFTFTDSTQTDNTYVYVSVFR